MKTIKNLLLVLVLAVFAGCVNDAQLLDEDEIGLRSESVMDEDLTLKNFDYTALPAGESKVIERAFENAPPMISHDVEGMMEISKDFNACITCHSPELAEAMNATPVPASHTYDTFLDKNVGQIVEARYNCNLCHTPQANVTPIVGNSFKADFRSETSRNRSNLLDVLDEGVQ